MLKRNHFLFSQNRGTDNMTWSGLWRAPFMLQTFVLEHSLHTVHHFNFIQGQMEVPALNGKLAGPCTALALSCTAVCQTLTLVAENHITFKSSNSTSMWTAIILKVTRCYLEPIKGLSNKNFALVVDDTQKYVKKGTATSSTVDLGEEDTEYEDLFAFC
ncbi:hypothetical protein PISMIDRAFT_28840 [Pisolithus microcarpus 441]|uniref:Uncharacterized protein n=1 Tax=Pisolithus microcarpus 441 TaxID=765257 RepID=A0A0C9ZZZ8_9AGAM|nr:hypothetical protein BKA83DRAFT_28840 [Pisolithus microcarpus]KIK25373.1 hypothetical protein PISMIDRAFT_28840 [Pisolithus microcarpus 441]